MYPWRFLFLLFRIRLSVVGFVEFSRIFGVSILSISRIDPETRWCISKSHHHGFDNWANMHKGGFLSWLWIRGFTKWNLSSLQLGKNEVLVITRIGG